jgi:hypothetical protein
MIKRIYGRPAAEDRSALIRLFVGVQLTLSARICPAWLIEARLQDIQEV